MTLTENYREKATLAPQPVNKLTCRSSSHRFQTPHRSVLKVVTVVLSQGISRTVQESGFSACTLDIVQVDWARALAEESKTDGGSTCEV